MIDLVDRYLRSLPERAEGRSAPEERQDLGTLLCWLLQEEGYEVLLPAWRQEGAARRNNKGVAQHGVDISARREEAGGWVLYLFVLKAGNVGKGDLGREDSLVSDLRMLLSRAKTQDLGLMPPGDEVSRRVVVAVHNGDRDLLDEQVRQLPQTMARQFHPDGFQWWSAQELVPRVHEQLESSADPLRLFPPAARPFYRLVYDGLRVPDRVFDAGDFDRLLQHTTTLDEPPKWLDVGRRAQELGLYTAMITGLVASTEKPRTLMALAWMERCICKLSSLASTAPGADAKSIWLAVRGLLAQYVGGAQRLAREVDSLLAVGTPYVLALGSSSDAVDYPFRVLTIGGRLAVATMVAADLKDAESIDKLRATLCRLAEVELPGLCTPLTDDHVIELRAVTQVLEDAGRHDLALRVAEDTTLRMVRRHEMGLPLPAIWQTSTLPLAQGTAHLLAEAWFGDRAVAVALGFEDRASSILVDALGTLRRLDGDAHAVPLHLLAPSATAAGARTDGLTLQVWDPTAEAWPDWYKGEVRRVGVATTFKVSQWEQAVVCQVPRVETPASARAMPSVDWIAALLFRHPVPRWQPN